MYLTSNYHHPPFTRNPFILAHFQQVFPEVTNEILMQINKYVLNNYNLDCHGFDTNSDFINNIIEQLNNKKAAFNNTITNKIVKLLNLSFNTSLTKIFNKCLQFQIFSANWKLLI